ncbi:MAG TPA: exosortase A [Allosphingosinicella sp.]|jgi:exosortase A
MTALLPIAKADTVAGWRPHLVALGAAWAAILLLFARDGADMVRIWWTSATFNHCLLVLPIIFWLVWQRLPELRQLSPAAWAPGLVVIAAGGLAWLLGEAGSLALFRHAGLVLMLQGAAIACLGKAVSRGLAFPIFYAFFLIPAGEELVPPLQTLTAEMSMALLALVSLPAHIEGIFISTPSGLFRVAEACSGVRFLVAMIAYGALVANVCFRTWPKRLLFMVASIAVPILANGVRAWGTIYVAHLTDNQMAVGVDHLIYGWVFFALVIAAIMAGAWRFFDRKPGNPWFDPAALQGGKPGVPSRAAQLAAAAVALAALPPLWSAGVAAAGRVEAPRQLTLPNVPGWTRIPATSGRAWTPRFAGADLMRVARYRNGAGQEVDLAIAFFSRQDENRELVGYGQGAAPPDGAWSWTADLPAPAGGKAERIAGEGVARDVVSFYRVGDILTGSSAGVKLETMKVRLLGGPQRAVAVLVSSQAPGEGLNPRPAIDAFLRDLGPVESITDQARAPR